MPTDWNTYAIDINAIYHSMLNEPSEKEKITKLLAKANAGLESLKELSTKYKDKYKLVDGKLVMKG